MENTCSPKQIEPQVSKETNPNNSTGEINQECDIGNKDSKSVYKDKSRFSADIKPGFRKNIEDKHLKSNPNAINKRFRSVGDLRFSGEKHKAEEKTNKIAAEPSSALIKDKRCESLSSLHVNENNMKQHETTKTESERKGRVWYSNRNRYRQRNRGKAITNNSNDEKGNARSDKGSSSNNKAIDSTEFHALDKQTIVSRGKLQGLENAFEKLSCKRKGDKPAINSIQITDKPPSGKKSSVHRDVDRGKGCVTASIDVNIDSDTSKRNDAMKYNPKQCIIFCADLKESVKVDVKVEKKNNERRPNTNNKKAGKCDTISGDQRKKNMPARPCDLYVVLTDPISERSQIKEYLNHRMGNPRSLVFGVGTLSKQSQSCDDNGSLNTVVMKLPSYNKACDARHLLNKSNRNTESKVHCFFTEDEAKGAKKKTDIDKSQLMQSAIQDLVGRAHEVLDKHDTKIREVQGFLEATENKLSRKRGLPFNEFEMLTNTKLAQDDKLEELSGQRKEFCNYIQAMKTKINEIQNNRKFENDLREIRKMFGVECQKLITALPMYARREDILTTVKHNQVSIVLGETGSGKSTQMVQYLYQAGFADEGLIVCTQPRKIAAVSLATHVASELTSSVGQVVGYKVGMQSKKTALTKVMFMTDHVLLNECLRDANLSAYSCIIIDEAHERSIHTDLLLGMLKKCTTKRPELRVVITSATIDPDVFVTYFGGSQKCPVLSVSGRTFPVEVLWESVDWSRDTAFPDNYEAKALDKAIEVHTSNAVADGDILVFLTSAVETERCCEKFQKKIQGNDYHCLQLHGKLKPDEQQLVFAKNPRGKRKIVFATNSAETSITIPGIKFVIDTGVAKEMRYDPKKNMNSLVVCPISQSSANQRKGRAGRTASGICYRLYTDRDFQSMHKCSTPEILRIHLGQGILKLMELGVNPMTFDFVKPPSSGAMEAALETLVEIGAVEGTDITGLGKWIAKLPVEPRLGAMIKKGIDDGVATEAIVIAASCSQNGIFFRVGSAEQKKKADLKKVRFCHVGGDLLTLLSAFREWDKVNEKGKGKWCVDNSINGKSMKVIRDVMNETLSILRKEAQLKLKHEFRNPDEADSIVQKLIFNCMKSNVCFYLGHEKAGYVTADRLQHVKVHPSSSLLSLGQQPTWVIYSQLLKTSDDFITNITPVPEEYIDDAIEKELLKIDKEKLERRQVKLVMKIPVGKHVFWKLIGPMHTNRREVEDNIRSVCSGTVVVVEADKFRGEITLYCVPKYKGDATAMLEGVVTSLPEQLLLESREEPIGHDFSGVRALLREGGAVSTILMPDQYRSLNIKQKDFRRYELTEDGVHLQFSFYGQIEQVWKSCGKRQQNQIYWGRVTFVNESDALSAVEEINDDENCDFTVVPITYRSSVAKPEEFTMKLKWCRRPAKGICYVYLSCPEDMARLLMASPIEIDGGLVHINQSREQSDLYIRGFDPDITEDLVKEGLLEALNLSPQNHGNRFKIIIPRKIVPIQHDEMNQIHEKLTRILSRFAQPATFRTDIRDYKQQTAFCTAFVKFGNPKICSDVAKGLIVTEADINGNLIDVTTEFKTTVFLNRRVYEATKKDIDDFIEMRRQKRSTTSVKLRTLKSGNLSIDINSESPERLAKVKVAIDAIVGGDVLELGTRKNFCVLFSRNGKQKMQSIEKKTSALIFIDDRTMKVTVQGSKQNRMKAVGLIGDYCEELATAVERDVPLKGQGNPPGLMKAILMKYGITLEKLRAETDLISIKLNLRMHELAVTGSEAAIKKAVEAVESIKKETVTTEKKALEDDELPDCPICLCPIEITELCRLEYCGHGYCNTCLISMIQSGVQDKQFPIKCASEGCDKSLVIRDINTQIRQGNLKRKELLHAALGCFVTKNNAEFKYCITPDCDMVYRVTSEGKAFTCSLCATKTCTSCHIPFHEGMTCAMYKSAKSDDNSLQKWLKEKPMKRKLCPSCEIGIEKIDGCDHMTCKCGVHICWKCMKHFDSGSECYGHLSEAHNSFM